MKLVITGYPRTGKTTLAHELAGPGVKVLHTDDVLTRWDNPADSATVAQWFDLPGDWIIEGVLAIRAIRKWHAAHPGQPFPAQVIFLSQHVVGWTNRGIMKKGLDKVWDQVKESVELVTPEAVLV